MARAKRPPRRRSAPVRRSPSLPSAPSLEAVKARFGAYLATAEARRRMARLPGGVGVGFFAYAYLGMATPACHQRWYAEFEKHHRIVFLAPRNHGKSTAASVVYASHAIITNRNLRVLLIRRTKTAAAKGLRMVREILAREAVVRDWAVPEEGGSFQRKGLSWTSSYFYLARGLDAMDPTFEVVGFGGAITGGHFDLIILDDVEDDKSTLTERQREKTLEWFRGTVLPMLEVGGRVIVIGTRKHGDDLYGRLWKDPTFTVIEDKAILEWPDMSRVRWVEKRDPRTGRAEIVDVEIPADAPGKCLWPEKNAMRVLLLAQKSIGSILFTREYQNEITDDLATPFRPDWMQAAKARGAGQGFLTGGVVAARGRELAEDVAQHPYCEGLYLYQCWDFAIVDDAKRAQRQDADWCVGQTWGYDWEVGERYLLRMVRRRGLSQGQIQALVRAEAALFPQRVAVIVENNNFGRLIEMGLRASSSLRRPCTGRSPSADPAPLLRSPCARHGLRARDERLGPGHGRRAPRRLGGVQARAGAPRRPDPRPLARRGRRDRGRARRRAPAALPHPLARGGRAARTRPPLPARRLDPRRQGPRGQRPPPSRRLRLDGAPRHACGPGPRVLRPGNDPARPLPRRRPAEPDLHRGRHRLPHAAPHRRGARPAPRPGRVTRRGGVAP